MFPLALLLILGPVYFFTAYAPPRYESKAKMWLAGRMNLAEGRVYNEDIVNFLGTQAELLRSPSLQNRVIAKIEITNARPTRPRAGVSQAGLTWGNGSADYLQSLHDDVVESLKRFQPSRTNAESPYKLEVSESSR